MRKDLSRFVEAHKRDYQTALHEIRNGEKRSHWMWYIFPQMQGLGRSECSRYYAILDLDEADAFLNDPYLGGHLLEISRALLDQEEDDPRAIFGSPDDLKLKSCMTLFAYVSESDSVFHRVLDKYFHGQADDNTLKILARDR